MLDKQKAFWQLFSVEIVNHSVFNTITEQYFPQDQLQCEKCLFRLNFSLFQKTFLYSAILYWTHYIEKRIMFNLQSCIYSMSQKECHCRVQHHFLLKAPNKGPNCIVIIWTSDVGCSQILTIMMTKKASVWYYHRSASNIGFKTSDFLLYNYNYSQFPLLPLPQEYNCVFASFYLWNCDVIEFRPKVCYCNTFTEKRRKIKKCCSKCCCS